MFVSEETNKPKTRETLRMSNKNFNRPARNSNPNNKGGSRDFGSYDFAAEADAERSRRRDKWARKRGGKNRDHDSNGDGYDPRDW